MKTAAAMPDSPVKEPQAAGDAPGGARRRWLVPAAAAGLVILGAGLALSVALPITLRRPMGTRGYEQLAVGGGASAPEGVERAYFLATDPAVWDYAPAGRDVCKGRPFGEAEALYITAGKGTKYKKALFREYADAGFQVRAARGARSWRRVTPRGCTPAPACAPGTRPQAQQPAAHALRPPCSAPPRPQHHGQRAARAPTGLATGSGAAPHARGLLSRARTDPPSHHQTTSDAQGAHR